MRRNSDQTADIGSAILQCVRANDGISRVRLAKKLGLAPSTVGLYVERLVSNSYLIESEKTSPRSGRPAIILRTNSDGGQFIGVDFEARNIMAVAVDFSDQPLRDSHYYIEHEDSVEVVIKKIAQAISDVMPEDSSRALAIGVGVPGIVNSTIGVASQYKYIKGWKDVPLADHLSQRFGIPVFLENSVRSMALAELWFGQGRGINNFLCVGVRSGVGAGIIVNGELFYGAHHGAGELGRIRVSLNDDIFKRHLYNISDGKEDSLELQDLVSARAIRARLERAIASGKESILCRLKERIRIADVTQAVQQRDALTRGIVENAAVILGRCVGDLVLVLDPAKVILAGPVALWGNVFLDAFKEAVESAVTSAGLTIPRIVTSSMGDYSGALGASALALHKWKPSIESMPLEPRKAAK